MDYLTDQEVEQLNNSLKQEVLEEYYEVLEEWD